MPTSGREYKADVTGINISQSHIDTARAVTKELGLEDTVRFLHGNAMELPIPSDAIDGVWTMNMFYHILDKKQAMLEFARVLPKGGVLAFDDWLLTQHATDEDKNKLKNNWCFDDGGDWISDGELKEMLGSVGFRLKEYLDLAHVGQGPMARHFRTTYDRDFRSQIDQAYPPQDGIETVATTFCKDIEHTIALYLDKRMTYVQLVAEKV